MCGFVGFTGMRAEREAILHRMADRIIHRGPDMEGYHLSGDTPENAVALGFRRLSIIDLAAGKQPMYNEDGTVVVVFNGEIFNFMDLRTELQAKGHIFKTHCDTEVILHGYEEYGTALAAKLRGMFAFVVCDTKTNTLYGARDMFGIKPFYYTQTSEGELLFGSEIKSLLEHPGFRREVNAEALRPYLTFQYSAMNETFFKGTYKLPPAHWFEYKNGQMHIERYWDADFRHKTSLTYEQAADEIDARVRESVAAHRISDVKLGSFLSGGVDSSYITACLMPDDTFSVGFESPDGTHKFDETTEAGELSQKLGIHNYREMLTKEQCLDAFADIQYHMDEPQSNPSSVPLYFLCQLARQHVTVVLSGEGADEFFGGYRIYQTPFANAKLSWAPKGLLKGASKAARALGVRGANYLERASETPEDWYYTNANGVAFSPEERERLRAGKRAEGSARPAAPQELIAPAYAEVAGLDDTTRMQYVDLFFWLVGDILLKTDKMSMAHSLESRVPFLDKRVFEVSATIPTRLKANGEQTKLTLREAAERAIPKDWAQKEKLGFPVPVVSWLRQDRYYDEIKAWFTGDIAERFFDTGELVRLLDEHKAGADRSRKIWIVYMFLMWYKIYFVDQKAPEKPAA